MEPLEADDHSSDEDRETRRQVDQLGRTGLDLLARTTGGPDTPSCDSASRRTRASASIDASTIPRWSLWRMISMRDIELLGVVAFVTISTNAGASNRTDPSRRRRQAQCARVFARMPQRCESSRYVRFSRSRSASQRSTSVRRSLANSVTASRPATRWGSPNGYMCLVSPRASSHTWTNCKKCDASPCHELNPLDSDT